jgi:hypothetical protein
MNRTLKFRKKVINQLFPDKYTKLRIEDFIVKAIENKSILNQREYNSLINQKHDIINRKNRHFEFYAKKTNNKIELIPFD